MACCKLHTERTRARGLVGQIYMGRVVRVLPGMQAAFIDIGLERSAFIHEKNLRGDLDQPITSGPREGPSVQIEKIPSVTKARGSRRRSVYPHGIWCLCRMPITSVCPLESKTKLSEATEKPGPARSR